MLAQISSAGTIYGVRRATRADVGPIVASDQIGAPRDGTEDLGSYDAAFDAIDADPALLVVASDDGGAVVATMQLTFIPGSTASTAGSVSAGRTTASS